MELTRYSALIRTFNSQRTLPATIASLAGQTVPPAHYVAVDSGSTDDTFGCLPANTTLHRFKGREFNYSAAINQGLAFVDTNYVLVISSHTALLNPEAVGYALELLERRDDLGAAYFCSEGGEALDHIVIGRQNFNGFNGVWNTCGLYKMSLLRDRAFRPEVFSAEDQEWSKWLLEEQGLSIARILGGRMSYNASSYPIGKVFKEHLSVALFVRHDMLEFPYLARTIYRVIRPVSSLRNRVLHARLLLNFLYYRFRGQPLVAAWNRKAERRLSACPRE